MEKFHSFYPTAEEGQGYVFESIYACMYIRVFFFWESWFRRKKNLRAIWNLYPNHRAGAERNAIFLKVYIGKSSYFFQIDCTAKKNFNKVRVESYIYIFEILRIKSWRETWPVRRRDYKKKGNQKMYGKVLKKFFIEDPPLRKSNVWTSQKHFFSKIKVIRLQKLLFNKVFYISNL